MAETSRRWVTAETFAIPVRVTFAAVQGLDALEQAVLGLCSIRPMGIAQMAELLAIQSDLLISVVTGLSETGLLCEDGGLFTADSEDALERRAGAAHAAWIVLDPRTGRPIPRLWVCKVPPRGSRSLDENRWRIESQDFRRFRSLGELSEPRLQESLSSLCLASDVLCHIPASGRKDYLANSSDENELSLPGDVEPIQSIGLEWDGPEWSEVTLRSLLLRTDGVHKDRKSWTTVSCRLAVDFIPQVVGPARFVAHEPDIDAGPEERPDLPISDLSLQFLLTECRNQIESHAADFAKAGSIVLANAGIRSHEELKQIVHDRFAKRCTSLGRVMHPLSPMEQIVDVSIQAAQEWLVISQREPRHQKQVRDAYGHAIESLCRELGIYARPSLESWAREWTQSTKGTTRAAGAELADSGYQNRRLSGLGLVELLKHSLAHLRSACERPQLLVGSLSRDDHGAGKYLIYFLLPLVLLEEDEAKLYAKPIQNALAHEPGLFEFLNDLILVRNDVFHDRGGAGLAPFIGQPDAIDDRIMRVWCAVLAGRYSSRTPSDNSLADGNRTSSITQ